MTAGRRREAPAMGGEQTAAAAAAASCRRLAGGRWSPRCWMKIQWSTVHSDWDLGKFQANVNLPTEMQCRWNPV
jgi:hypothetical protein